MNDWFWLRSQPVEYFQFLAGRRLERTVSAARSLFAPTRRSFDYQIHRLAVRMRKIRFIETLSHTNTRLKNGGPARTRTWDQGIHCTHSFPNGADYLITLDRIVRGGTL